MDNKIILLLLFSIICGFAIRIYPHTQVYRFMNEEPYNYITVDEILTTGITKNQGFYPIFEHQVIAYFSQIFHIDPISLSIIFNPLISALTAIPIFLIFRKYLKDGQSLLISLFWCLSEAVFYRSAGFYTTEPLSLFFMFFALYFYTRKNYVGVASFAVLSLITHLLPFAFLSATIFAEKFIFGSRKFQIISILGIVSTAIFVYSPLNPYRRIVSILDINYMMSKFNIGNIFNLYDLNTLKSGVMLFYGTLILIVITMFCVIQLVGQRLSIFSGDLKLNLDAATKISISMLLVSFGLVAFSWIVYNSMLFAPPRLLLFTIVPLSFFVVFWINQPAVHGRSRIMLIFVICSMMVCSSFAGSQTMLWSNNSLTKNEYLALDEIQQTFGFDRAIVWWCDYPINTEITSRVRNDVIWEVNISPSVMIEYFKKVSQENSTLSNDTIHIIKYAFISERMKQEGMFIQFTETRTIHSRRPVIDIWNNNINWKLVYDNHGVKVYERLDYTELLK